MNFPNLNDSASYATITGTVVAIVTALFGAYKFLSRTDRQEKMERTNTDQPLKQGNQLHASDGGSITINGNISTQHATNPKLIPETLARPSFSAKQTGMQNGGYPHRTIYTIAVRNNGGNSFNVNVKIHDRFNEKLATLGRGREHEFPVDLTDRPNRIELVIDCHDENGEARSQRLLGTKIGGDYEFTD